MWLYKGKELKEPPENKYGFLYTIQAVDLDTDKITYYYGKKALTHRKKTYLSKKARKGTRKRVSITQKDSGWMEYNGSSKPFLAYLQERGNRVHTTRIINMFCDNRQTLAYRELELLIRENVLFREDCWNANVAGKYFKGKIS